MNLRDFKKQQARAEMARATEALSLAQGFDEVAVDQIAAAATVSRRTFFRYFKTKEQAFFADHEARLHRFRGALAEAQEGESSYQRVRRCLLALASEYDLDRPQLAARHRVISASPDLLSYELTLDRLFEEAIIDTLTPADATPAELNRARILGAAVFGVVRAVLRPWLDDPGGPSLRSRGADALDILEQGILHTPS